MSVSYYSYAVIGISMDASKLQKQIIVRNCQCNVVGMTPRFCPQCGKPFVRNDQGWIDGCNPSDYPNFLFDLPLIFSTDRKIAVISSNACSVAKTGWSDDTGVAFKQIEHLDIEKAKSDLRSRLEPLGLWDEKKFGLYAVQYCSY